MPVPDPPRLDTMQFAKDGIILADPEGRITYVDDGVWRMLGLVGTADQTLEKLSGRVRFEGALTLEEVLRTAIQDVEWQGDAVGTGGDGRAIQLAVRAHQAAMNPGGPSGVVMILRNVSRDQLLEEKVLDLQQMELVEKLTRGIAHEFKNLLTIISAYGSLLESQVPDAIGRDEIQKILETTIRANDLTRRMVSVTRRPQPEVENSDLEEVLLEIGALTAKSMPSQVMVECCPPRRMPLVRVDNAALIRAAVHLALNGCEAMPNGGTLKIDCRAADLADQDGGDPPPGRYVVITVTDSGNGMDPDTQARLFEPFFTTKQKGTGLGLCSVKRSIESMGGILRIDSEPDQGTTAHIFLPVVSAPA